MQLLSWKVFCCGIALMLASAYGGYWEGVRSAVVPSSSFPCFGTDIRPPTAAEKKIQREAMTGWGDAFMKHK